MNKKNIAVYLLLLLAVGMGTAEVLLNSYGELVSDATQSLWSLVFVIITIIWVIADADTNNFEKPFDFGFLIYIFWPVALPYYLVSTRGVEGIVLFLGFVGIWIGPWLAGLIAYTYFV